MIYTTKYWKTWYSSTLWTSASLLGLCLLAILPGCRIQTGGPPGEETFEEFYQRFHEDTAFQMERISFPLEGLPDYADSTDMYSGEFRWQKDEWVYHRPPDENEAHYTREFIRVTDDLIVEYIKHKNAGLSMERRWAKLQDGWNLIYYAGINYLK